MSTTFELFERVRAHLLNQNRRSVDAHGCAYRGTDGLSCAVGCLIKDEFYNSEMEGKNVDHPMVVYALEKSIDRRLCAYEVHQLVLLQSIHDVIMPSDWASRLKDLKKRLVSGGSGL